MLTICYKTTEGAKSVDWTVGTVPEFLPTSEDVVTVQADGAELAHLFDNTLGVPFAFTGKGKDKVLKPSQLWTGEMAKFIAMNLIF